VIRNASPIITFSKQTSNLFEAQCRLQGGVRRQRDPGRRGNRRREEVPDRR